MCQRYLSKNLGPVHTYLDIFEKKKRKKTKWLRAKGTKPPLIEYHDLTFSIDISPVKVRAQTTPNAISPVYTSRKIKVKINVREDKPPLIIRAMSATRADTFTSELKSTRELQSETA